MLLRIPDNIVEEAEKIKAHVLEEKTLDRNDFRKFAFQVSWFVLCNAHITFEERLNENPQRFYNLEQFKELALKKLGWSQDGDIARTMVKMAADQVGTESLDVLYKHLEQLSEIAHVAYEAGR